MHLRPAPYLQTETDGRDAGTDNMRQLIALRWLAVLGQLGTILFVHLLMGIELPLIPMLAAVGVAALVNLASLPVLKSRQITNGELLLALLFDVGLLTLQLYLSGGSNNPFISLYLLQVVLGAILLETWSSWAIVFVTGFCTAFLTVMHRPLIFPAHLLPKIPQLYAVANLLCFALIATLLVVFVTRIGRNLRARTAYLDKLRQQAAEEEHIVRMGLLASGAAHELGTPLASLAVILSDWRREPKLKKDATLLGEIEEMQAEVQRCKTIVGDILRSAGEPRGEAPEITSVHNFLERIVTDWSVTRSSTVIEYENRFTPDQSIVSDPTLRQSIWNVLENAAEASPQWVGVTASRDQDALVILVADRGSGFPPALLENLGKPYQSSKGDGHGVGLFLVQNVLRKLGSRLEADNDPDGGARVTLRFPLSTIGIRENEL